MAAYCPRWNTANREASRFCNNCGESLGAAAETTCPTCKAPVLTYSTYCHHCGAQLPQPPAPAIAPPEPITEADETQGDVAEETEVISLDQVPLPEGETRAAVTETQRALPMQPPESQTRPVVETGIAQPHTEPTKEAAPSVAPVPVSQEPPADESTRVVQPLVRVRPSPARSAPPPPPPQPRDRSDLWRRLSYLVLAAAIISGLLLPIGTLGSSTPAAPEVHALYNAIQGLPQRSVALVSFDYDTATADEMNPLAQAVIYHLMQRQARILVMSLLPQGPALAEGVILPLAEKIVYSYGLDYVNLGYLSGDEAALASLGAGVQQAFTADFVHGRPPSDFIASRAVVHVSDLNLIVDIAGDDTSVRRWVEQVQSRYGLRLGAATSAAAVPLAFPYVQSGQIIGLAGGLPAAAQYEQLLGYTGPATRGMDAQSLGHLAILLFIAIANVGLVARRKAVA